MCAVLVLAAVSLGMLSISYRLVCVAQNLSLFVYRQLLIRYHNLSI